MKYLLFSICFSAIASFNAKAQVPLTHWENIADRVHKGKDTLYVINFWATWCGPCVKELPYFDALPAQQSGVPVKVLLLSMDFASELKKSVIPFVKKRKIQSEVLLLQEDDQQALIDKVDKQWSGALPATLFLYGAKNKRQFFEQEFTATTLRHTVQGIVK